MLRLSIQSQYIIILFPGSVHKESDMAGYDTHRMSLPDSEGYASSAYCAEFRVGRHWVWVELWQGSNDSRTQRMSKEKAREQWKRLTDGGWKSSRDVPIHPSV